MTTITGGGTVAAGTQQNCSPFIPFPPLAVQQHLSHLARWLARRTVDVARRCGLYAGAELRWTPARRHRQQWRLAGCGWSRRFAQLAKSGSAQITSITKSANGKLYLCTANPGKVFSLGPEYEPEGTYESRSFDAQLFSRWGRIDWWSPPPAASAKSTASSGEPRLEFFVRSGNTKIRARNGHDGLDRTETDEPWSHRPARFVQWKAVIHDGRPVTASTG